jgi:hypothetical protein
MALRGTAFRAAGTLAAGLIALAIAGAAPATAGPVADDAAEAESLMGAGNAPEALAAFDKAAAAFWISSPLQLRKALFADSISGFGEYTPHGDAPFKPGERATVYLEPFGYAFVPDGDGFRIGLATDLQIRTPGGLILAKAENFGGLDWRGRAKSREVHAQVGIDLPDLKSGSYELVLTLRDQNSPKTTTATLPFSVAGP